MFTFRQFRSENIKSYCACYSGIFFMLNNSSFVLANGAYIWHEKKVIKLFWNDRSGDFWLGLISNNFIVESMNEQTFMIAARGELTSNCSGSSHRQWLSNALPWNWWARRLQKFQEVRSLAKKAAISIRYWRFSLTIFISVNWRDFAPFPISFLLTAAA